MTRQKEVSDRLLQGRGLSGSATAGLHFTEELIEKIQRKGVKTAYVTLHVGIVPFRPGKCETDEEHNMHFLEYEIDENGAAVINETIKAGGRIVSVGTTSTRTLESAANEDGIVAAGRGSTGIFIYPGYRFKVIDSLITNFHLPRSTLLMLVSALYNREAILAAYKEAVEQRFRFFRYGDAMLIFKKIF
jgi:S-adenosylmethionine:tRNA ribosyltransferase-isomerase